MSEEFNMIVLGAGPAGQAAAKKAAFFGRKVAIVDELSGELSSAARIRKVMFRIYGLRNGSFLKPIFASQAGVEVDQSELDFARKEIFKAFTSITHDEEAEKTAITEQVKMRNVTFFQGRAKFANLDEVEVFGGSSGKKTLTGSNFVIAVGAKHFKPGDVRFDDEAIVTPDSIFNIKKVPASAAVYGSGVGNAQYAITLALMGSSVSWIMPDEDGMPKMDDEIKDEVFRGLEDLGISILRNRKITEAFRTDGGEAAVKLRIADGSELDVDLLLHNAQRVANTEDLGCIEAGIEMDDAGSIVVNEDYRTNLEHIYAVGDVVKSPLTESERKHQGTLAATKVFGLQDTEQLSDSYPVGVYTLPEAGSYGYTETDAKSFNIRYVVGRADYANSPYGRNADSATGFLKILVNIDTEEIIGVHVVGRFAHEAAHFAILLVEAHVPVGKLTGTVFNGSTVQELYHFAAINAWTKLRAKT